MTNWLKHTFSKLKVPIKIAASDPKSFSEMWSFKANYIQMASLFFLILTIASIPILLIYNGLFGSYQTKEDVSIERKTLEIQHNKIEKLNKKLIDQTQFINDLKVILNGKIIKDQQIDTLNKNRTFINHHISQNTSNSEKELFKKVKENMYTKPKLKNKKSISIFTKPVKGIISQKFDLSTHPAIDIVTRKSDQVLSCLSGTVIYATYSLKDGNVIIIDHHNGFLSIYKHNKTILKKIGTKVQESDPIAIVGNSGENTSGPHLHFELWYNQTPVNPTKYIQFD